MRLLRALAWVGVAVVLAAAAFGLGMLVLEWAARLVVLY
jgi:hypothetical protein